MIGFLLVFGYCFHSLEKVAIVAEELAREHHFDGIVSLCEKGEPGGGPLPLMIQSANAKFWALFSELGSSSTSAMAVSLKTAFGAERDQEILAEACAFCVNAVADG